MTLIEPAFVDKELFLLCLDLSISVYEISVKEISFLAFPFEDFKDKCCL